MSSELRGHQEWLEAPYQDAIEESDRFMDWAEEEGYDLDNPESLDLAELAYQDYLNGLYEAWAEDEYNEYLDRKEMEMSERYYDDSW
jgi:hypothetical protein